MTNAPTLLLKDSKNGTSLTNLRRAKVKVVKLSNGPTGSTHSKVKLVKVNGTFDDGTSLTTS